VLKWVCTNEFNLSQNKMRDTRADNDIRTYRWAAFTLLTGMYSSFAAMGVGLIWWLIIGSPGGTASMSKALPLDRVFPELLAGNPLALLNLGVLLLLATPGVTLLSEIVAYALDRNWRYLAISSVVGAILVLSVTISMKWIG
jgi:uncharacterized membrane protein